MIPSKKQQAIYDLWDTTDKNILIQAVAGSGKTTTLLELMAKCKWKTLYIALNKTIQLETEEKMKSRGYQHTKAVTLHSLGLSAIKNVIHKVEIDAQKNWKILQILDTKEPHYFSMKSGYYESYEEIMRLKFTLIDMNDVSRAYLENDPDTILEHMINMDKMPYENKNIDMGRLWEKFIDIREEMNNRVPLVIDFLDMIFLPARGDYYIPIDPYYLMLDEAQDFNLAQHKLIDNLINQGDIHKWIAVGDRRQSIYGFAGSYAESFDLFTTKKDVVEMPLDICYRCDTCIINIANKVYPVLIPFKESKGSVDTYFNIDKIKERPESMVICRNKGPLISLYFDLVAEGVKCKLYGDDILSSVVRFLGSYKRMSVSSAKSVMDKEMHDMELEIQNGKVTEMKKKIYYIFKENYNNFLTLSNKLNIGYSESVQSVIDSFKALFSEDGKCVTLCTIHKSKGLEADTVFILNEFLIPSPFAKSQQQLAQETNLKYVARTRAKKELFFLNISGES